MYIIHYLARFFIQLYEVSLPDFKKSRLSKKKKNYCCQGHNVGSQKKKKIVHAALRFFEVKMVSTIAFLLISLTSMPVAVEGEAPLYQVI